MMAIATLRKHFGLSQSQLAQLLDVSTGYIKMAESGNRNLSPLVLKNFLTLVTLVKSTAVAAKAEIEVGQNKTTLPANAELNKYIAQTGPLLVRQKKILAKMEMDYQQALNRQFLLQEEQKKRGHSDSPGRWLQKLIDKTSRQLQESGVVARALLQLKIDTNAFGLQQALQLAEQLKTK